MPKFGNNTSIAFAKTYFTSQRALPVSVLRDLNSFIQQFTQDPTSQGLNYEKIQSADGTLRSARINKAYRAIIKIPQVETQNVFTLLWVDSHDEAYEWARKKHIGVNPVTNAIEIYDIFEKDEESIAMANIERESKLFDDITDNDLKQMNISENLFFVIRAVAEKEDLDRLKNFIPANVFEYLSFLSYGISAKEVIEMAAADSKDDQSQSKSFEEAVLDKTNEDGFYIVDSDEGAEEFKRVMDDNLEEWRIFMHQSQHKIVQRFYSGPACIIGGPGTGKTVVAMHRAKWLAENICQQADDKILFTTFSKNLADDTLNNLKHLCGDALLRKIEVVNLDKWINDNLTKYGVIGRLIFGEEVRSNWSQAVKNINVAIKLPIDFYIDEYEKVILANEAKNFEEYRLVRRNGRGISLNRSQKYEVWRVVEAYHEGLNKSHTIDISTAATRIIENIKAEGIKVFYRSIIVDESQDFGDVSFKLIRAITGPERDNDIFIVGDSHQRIYGKKVILKHCGIHTIGRSGSLKINYRTTEEIRSFAETILQGSTFDDLDDGIDEGRGYLSLTHGKAPITLKFKSANEEYDAVCDQIKNWLKSSYKPSDICIVARTMRQIDAIRKHLGQQGIPFYEIKNSKAEDVDSEGVRIASMHRVKGLEFECVIIIDANNGIIPLDAMLNSSTDAINKKELLQSEQSLLYVAMTRAKKELIIMSSGRASQFLN